VERFFDPGNKPHALLWDSRERLTMSKDRLTPRIGEKFRQH
jgi:hypothetical protein